MLVDFAIGALCELCRCTILDSKRKSASTFAKARDRNSSRLDRGRWAHERSLVSEASMKIFDCNRFRACTLFVVLSSSAQVYLPWNWILGNRTCRGLFFVQACRLQYVCVT